MYSNKTYIDDSSTVYYTKYYNNARKDKSLLKDMRNLNLPEHIILRADRIYKAMNTGTRRSQKRKLLIFYVLFRAYDEENYTVDPNWLVNLCDIPSSGKQKAISLYDKYYAKTLNNKDDYLFKNKEPKDYLKIYFDRIKKTLNVSDESFEQIEKLCNIILKKDDNLYDQKPTTVAASIIVLYLENQGIFISKKSYKTFFCLSDMTVAKMLIEIKKAYYS